MNVNLKMTRDRSKHVVIHKKYNLVTFWQILICCTITSLC